MIRDGEIKGEADEHGVMRYTDTRNGVSANPQPEETKMEEPAEYGATPVVSIEIKCRPILVVSAENTIADIITAADGKVKPGEKFQIEYLGKKIRCRMPK